MRFRHLAVLITLIFVVSVPAFAGRSHPSHGKWAITAPAQASKDEPIKLASDSTPQCSTPAFKLFLQNRVSSRFSGFVHKASWRTVYKTANDGNTWGGISHRLKCDNSQVVPEPSTILAMAAGMGGLLLRIRRRR